MRANLTKSSSPCFYSVTTNRRLTPDRVKTLTDPAHRFKVHKNAEQINLTGLCIFNHAFSMVYVEGVVKFIRSYKNLLVNRIAWTEAARPRSGEEWRSTRATRTSKVTGTTEKGKQEQQVLQVQMMVLQCPWKTTHAT